MISTTKRRGFEMPIDYSRYPPNWKTEIVPRILERANNCCENCGIKNGSKATSLALKVLDTRSGRYKLKRFWMQEYGDLTRMAPFALPGETKRITVVLTIAHLDHDETNHDVQDERLRAWCQYCHLNYDAEEKYRRIIEKSEQRALDLST